MPNQSRIPIYGLVHLVDIVSREDSDDGAGGIIAGGASTAIYTKRKARVTVMKDEDEVRFFGNASGQHWQVLLEYSPNVARSQYLNVNASSRPAPIPTDATEYLIIYFKHQIDDKGRFHHTTLFMELEDSTIP